MTARTLGSFGVAAALAAAGCAAEAPAPAPVERRAVAEEARLMTLDPGHFHAALVQKEMYPGVSPRVAVYAPLGPDLLGHLGRVSAFNARAESPTAWALDVHASPDFYDRMIAERPGNVVVISGKNREKMTYIRGAVEAGFDVLADKPWILRSQDLPALEAVLARADTDGRVALDIMTERYEITSMVQRELVNDAAVFGEPVAGTPAEPGVYMESVHHLMKTVAGAPNIRPAWFFDTAEQGEGLNDIGTHLVDLVQWTLFPGQAIDHTADVRVLSAQRWPTMIAEADFRRVTGGAGFPAAVAGRVVDGRLAYDCNTLVTYTLRGIHVTLNVIWDWEAPAGAGDSHYAYYRGSRARIEVRQTKADGYRPELYVVPAAGADRAALEAALRDRVAGLQERWPGVAVEPRGGEWRVVIPDTFRVGHEAHFAEVTRAFLDYRRDRSRLPAWERPNMVAKYFVTTTGTELSREQPARPAPRLAP